MSDHSHKKHAVRPAIPVLRSGPLLGIGLVLGVAGLGGAWVTAGGIQRFAYAYLTGFEFFLTITIGAIFFVILHHLTRAGWSVTVRRVAELMAANIVTMFLLALPLLALAPYIYRWVNPPAGDELWHFPSKMAWLNLSFWRLRIVVYFVIWGALAWWYYSRSRRQDRDGDVRHTEVLQRYAGLAVVLFAIATNWAGFDLVMSLDPHWFSTIFGIYCFVAGMLGFFAAITVLTRVLQTTGRLEGVVTKEHYHDLGKWMFGFVIFWSYVAFAQYMLQWYGNMPEETHWFARHGASTNNFDVSPWGALPLILLFGKFAIPFLGLLSRWPKRKINLLVFWAVWMLAMHFADMYWLVMPEDLHTVGGKLVLEQPLAALWPALLAVVGVGGVWLAGFGLLAGGKNLIPTQDPRLDEALQFTNF